MSKKININEIFQKWLLNYKRNINFSIVNKPSKALNDSFNAGYTLSEKQNQQKMAQMRNCLASLKEKDKQHEDINKHLIAENSELQDYITKLEEELGYNKKRA